MLSDLCHPGGAASSLLARMPQLCVRVYAKREGDERPLVHSLTLPLILSGSAAFLPGIWPMFGLTSRYNTEWPKQGLLSANWRSFNDNTMSLKRKPPKSRLAEARSTAHSSLFLSCTSRRPTPLASSALSASQLGHRPTICQLVFQLP